MAAIDFYLAFILMTVTNGPLGHAYEIVYGGRS
jgi:hypothetical protein